MAQQLGRLLVIKRSAADDGSGARVFVCGIQTRSLSVANTEIENTVPDCDDPSLPLIATAIPGKQTIEFTGDGLFDNDAVGILVWDDSRLQRRTITYEVIIPGVGAFVGPFGVFDFQFTGEMEGSMGFSATWRPTDINTLVYTPA